MHLVFRLAPLACACFLGALPAWADPDPLPLPPAPTPPGSVVINPPSPPGVNPEESFPVVISYGQNQETRARIYRGVMDPVGMLPNQIVTVTLLLPSAWAGEPVRLGLYDGGQIGAANLPGTSIHNLDRFLAVNVEGKVQFNFQAGQTLGLYRVLLTVGPAQYLLQFYATTPRDGSLPIQTPTPPPGPRVTPTPN